jgi:hypothetical protein
MKKQKFGLTANEIKFVKTDESVRNAIAEALGNSTNTIWQWAAYKPHLLAKNPTAMRILQEYMAKPVEQPA